VVKVVEVVGGLATVYERNELVAGTLESILPFIENRVPVVLPILPRNNVVSAVYDESNPAHKRLEILLNVDPHVRLLDFSDPIDDFEPRLSFPHTLYFIEMGTTVETPQGQDWSMDQFRVFWSKTQVKSLDQDVIPALLPNIYEDGNVCFGDTGVNARQPLADRVDQLINEFLLTRFTAHEVREREWPWNGRTYRRWAQATETHGNTAYQRIPEFDLNGLTEQTVDRVLEAIMGEINVPAGATPLLNGEAVDGSAEVAEGDELAFTKPGGEKGLLVFVRS